MKIQKHIFYAPPTAPFTSDQFSSWLEMLRFDNSPYSQVARDRLNLWLNYWDPADLKEIQGRLHSPKHSQWYGAMSELYINAYLKSVGFKVQRLTSRGPGTSTPDFLVSRGKRNFYVEATSISKVDHTFEKNWKALVKSINLIDIPNALLSIRIKSFDKNSPSTNEIKKQIKNFSDQHSREDISYSWETYQYLTTICGFGGWSLEVTLIPRPSRARKHRNVAVESKSPTILITDGDDLKRKLDSKRKSYKRTDSPLVLFVLEMSFFGGFDWTHRFNTFYGDIALRVSLESNNAENVVQPNGIWNRPHLDTRLSGVILMPRLDVSVESLASSQLWLNPHVKSDWLKKELLLPSVSYDGSSIKPDDTGIYWDGLKKYSHEETKILRRSIQ